MQKLMGIAIFASLSFLTGISTVAQEQTDSEIRTWKDSTGQFSLTARLHNAVNGRVELIQEDGRRFAIEMEQLSAEDRAYVQRLTSTNPFQELPSPQKDSSGLVVIAVRREHQVYFTTGFIIEQRGDRTYVVCHQGLSMPSPVDTANLEFSVIPPSANKEAIPAEIVAITADRQTIISVSANELPPLKVQHSQTPPNRGDTVRLVGYTIDNQTEPRTYAWVATDVLIESVGLTADGVVRDFSVSQPEARPFRNGLVLNTRGELLGMASVTENRAAPRQLVASILPLPDLDELTRPRRVSAMLVPKSGDRKEIVYQLVLEISEPLKRLRDPEVRILGPTIQRPTLSDDEIASELETATPIRLTLGRGEEDIPLLLRSSHASKTGARPYVATFHAVNHGPGRDRQFTTNIIFELSFLDDDGSRVKQSPVHLAYSTLAIRDVASLPNIPGLDGVPLDVPSVQKIDDGYLLTSEITRVTEETEHVEDHFPQPQAGRGKIGLESREVHGLQATTLDIQSQRRASGSVGRAPMAWSADGSHAYFVDGSDILRKVRTAGLIEELSLRLKGSCNFIACSKAGLVLSLQGTDCLWVVDPQSLRVKYEVSIPNIGSVAANPSTAIGFVNALGERSSAGSESKLLMFNFETGQVIHSLKSIYGRHNFQVKQVFPVQNFVAMYMSSDGKFLYAGLNSIHQFRVAEQDLIYVQSSTHLNSGSRSHLALSVDGESVAMSSSATTLGNGMAVFQTKDLGRLSAILDKGSRSLAIGWDPKNEQIYVANDRDLHVFDSRGGKLTQFAHELTIPCRIMVHPQGGKFLIWALSKIEYVDSSQLRPMNN